MIAAGYGEDQPRLCDDRLPIILIILDGVGDRILPELGHLTPAEAARTPNLDRAAAAGMNGWHLPFGWGRAPSSELAHWAMFGYDMHEFPGRAILEGLGAGVELDETQGVLYAALRTSKAVDGKLWVTGRAERGKDDADAEQLLMELKPVLADFRMRLEPFGGRGEALLLLKDVNFAHVTDSDPFFETFHPWLKPHPTIPTARKTAARLADALISAREHLLASAVNARRSAAGRPPLDVLTTKWAGGHKRVPAFAEKHGVAGAAVTSSRFYRGLATYLGMPFVHVASDEDNGTDMKRRLQSAVALIEQGARFVHVHTKATDVAGHTKNPLAKRDVLAAIDAGLDELQHLATRSIVAITGDHATPSRNGVMHTGDPAPLTVLGPTVRPDPVETFGEMHAASGWLGQLQAHELLPMLAGFANRPAFMGHRMQPKPAVFLADAPAAMPLTGAQDHG